MVTAMKKIICVLLIFAISLLLFGCNNNGGETTTAAPESTESKAEVSADEIAAAVLESAEFEGDLEKSEFPFSTLEKYDVQEAAVEDICWYVGSGAAPDEIAVIKCAGSDELATVYDAIQARIKYLKDGYSDYAPEQVPKIDKACVIANGNLLVYCIGKDVTSVENTVKSLIG